MFFPRLSRGEGFRVITGAAVGALMLATASAGKVVEYNWNLRPRRTPTSDPGLSPDCFLGRTMLLVEDSNPGPEIRAEVGDTVRIRLINHHPSEATSLHFHGLRQLNNVYNDGSSTATQCPVGPMQTQVYEFKAMDAGTHYWHGHLSMNRNDGFQGPLVITNLSDSNEVALEEKYVEDHVVFLQDWYHKTGQERRTGLDTNPFIWIGNGQTYLMNGKGRFGGCFNQSNGNPIIDESDMCDDACTAENYMAPIDVVANSTYRLRIINAGELVGVNFAIAGHKLTVVEAEGSLVEPFEVDNLDIMPAQRYSVLITANQDPGSYHITTSVMYRNVGPHLIGNSYLNYIGSDAGPPKYGVGLPAHPVWNDPESGPGLDAKLKSADLSTNSDADILKENPNRELIIVGTQARNPDRNNLLRWALNNMTQEFPAEPVIVTAYDAVNAESALDWPETVIPGTITVPDKPPTTWNYTEKIQEYVGDKLEMGGPTIIKLTKGDVVDLVLQNALALNGVAEMHSWHLHGHSFYVIGEGYGIFDPETDKKTFNLDNPVRRDTIALWPKRWAVLRFKADNPGVWAFHCTQNSHGVMGMGLNFVVSPDMLSLPPAGVRSCTATALNDLFQEPALGTTSLLPTASPKSTPAPSAAPTSTPALTNTTFAPSATPSAGHSLLSYMHYAMYVSASILAVFVVHFSI